MRLSALTDQIADSERAAIEYGLRRLRITLVVFAAIDSLAALFSFLLLHRSGHATWVDYVLQATISASLLMMLAWFTMGVAKSLRRAALISGIVVGSAYVCRVLVSLYQLHVNELSLASDFPPITCYWPITVIFLFAMLTRDAAIRLGTVFITVSAVLALGYAAWHPDQLLNTARGLEIFQMLLFVNPLVLILMVISSEVHARVGQERLSGVTGRFSAMRDDVSQTDPVTGLLKVRSFIELLRGHAEDCRNSGEELTLAYLDRPGSGRSPQAERTFIAELRAAFGAESDMARFSQNRYAFAWRGKGISDVMDVALDLVLIHNENTEDPSQRVAVGLASWRAGEMIYATLERCDSAVAKARQPNSTGVSFSIDDLEPV